MEGIVYGWTDIGRDIFIKIQFADQADITLTKLSPQLPSVQLSQGFILQPEQNICSLNFGEKYFVIALVSAYNKP